MDLKAKKSLKDYFFVGLQFLLFGIYILPIRFYSFSLSPTLQFLMLAICLFGLLLILWAVFQLNNSLTAYPTPKNNSILIENGVYKYVRHPIYTGILLLFLGWAVYQGSGWKLLVCLFLFVLFWFKSGYEESQLTLKYPEYESYRKRSGRFLPFL